MNAKELNQRYQSLDETLKIEFEDQQNGIQLTLKKQIGSQAYQSMMPLPKDFNDQKMIMILGDFLKQLVIYYLVIV